MPDSLQTIKDELNDVTMDRLANVVHAMGQANKSDLQFFRARLRELVFEADLLRFDLQTLEARADQCPDVPPNDGVSK